MDTFGTTKSKINPRNILGGILGSFEEDFEKETLSMSSVTQGAGEVIEAIFSLGQDISGVEQKNGINEAEKFPSTGSIEFQKAAETSQKQKAEAERKKVFFQALKEDQERARQAKENLLFEEEINDIVSSLPTEQKNRLLHYQASYKDKSVYQRAELRKKLIEEKNKAAEQQKEASIPSPAKQPSAMEGAFEGRSGTQGGGTANLSAQAVG